MHGYCVSQVVCVAAKLELADVLADGPLRAAAAAERIGANEDALRRLLCALVTIGIVEERAPDLFALTSVGQLLRTDVAGSLRPFAILCGGDFYRLWGEFEHSVRTGEPTAQRVFGLPFFPYLASRPDAASVFNAAMASASAGRIEALSGLRWDNVQHVVDVGGGNGHVLAELLLRFKHLRGTLVELPKAAAEAERRFGREELSDRAISLTGDFFDQVPPGADVYLLVRVLHDWDDDHASRILANCRRAMGRGARLLIVDPIGEEQPDPWGDINMLVITGGRERTRAQWERLMTETDLEIVAVEHGDIIVATAALSESGPRRSTEEPD
jgi:SAM-dependent methyltransferase